MPAAWVERDIQGLHRRAWPFVLWGAAVVLLGVAVLAWPGLTAEVLIRLAGVAVLGFGLLLVYGAVRFRETSSALSVAALVPAIAVTAFGAVVLFLPATVATLVLDIIAVFALLAGVWDVVSGLGIVAVARWGWLRAARGALLAVFGLWVLLTPVSALTAAGWLIGLFAILLGVFSIALGAFALRT